MKLCILLVYCMHWQVQVYVFTIIRYHSSINNQCLAMVVNDTLTGMMNVTGLQYNVFVLVNHTISLHESLV